MKSDIAMNADAMTRATKVLMIVLLVLVFYASRNITMAVASEATSIPTFKSPESERQVTSGHFIQELGDQAIRIMSDENMTHERRTEKYRIVLHNSFDMPTIGHFVLGRSWNGATTDQRKEFMKSFEEVVLKTFGDRLNFFAGEKFQVKGAQKESDSEYIVNSEVTHSDGSKPTKIDWRVRWKHNMPQVIDIAVAGVSQSVTQRQEYSAIIQQDGGSIEGLLTKMRQQSASNSP